MASPNPNYGDLVTAGIEDRRKQLADNVTNHTPLLKMLKEGGRVRPATGGTLLIEEISYSGNDQYQRYSGYEQLSVAATEVLTSAEYEWKQVSIPVTISGLEKIKNSGTARMIELLGARLDNAEAEMKNGIATDVMSDGTADGGKQITGIQTLVNDTPGSGVVGGIDRANFAFWQNYARDASASALGAVSASNVLAHFNDVAINVVRNNDTPTMITADANYFNFFWQALQAIQRISDPSKGSAGFRSLEYYGPNFVAPVFFDSTVPTDHAYFLNTKYLSFRPHTTVNMKPEKRIPVDQDAEVTHILWAGNMTMCNAFLQGVLLA